MWDNAASLCFITNAKAKQEKLRGVKVNISIVKIGGQNEKIETMKYKLPLLDKQDHAVEFEVYGINKITSDIERVNVESIAHLFRNVTKDEIARPAGPVDVLIGYEYAAYHPEKEQNIGHLVLLKNRFGRCVGGTHPLLKEMCMTHNLENVRVNTIVGKVSIEDFCTIEALGIQCKPRCGGCKCEKCSLGAKDYTIQEERELELIERNLTFNSEDNTWQHKLSQRHVHKFSYPGKTTAEIAEAVDNIAVASADPSHVIIHTGTNNLSSESADSCVADIKSLVLKVKSKFPNSSIGLSGIVYREDINVDAKRIEVNERVKLTAVDDNFTYIDNSVIDASALNGSRLHLNAKGSSLLAVQFIKFLRSGSGKYNQSLKGFQSSAIQQLVKLLMELGNLPSPARNRRRPR